MSNKNNDFINQLWCSNAFTFKYYNNGIRTDERDDEKKQNEYEKNENKNN